MSAAVAATSTHYRYSDNPRTVRKPGGKHAGPIGVDAIPSIPAYASSVGVSPHKILPFRQCSVPSKWVKMEVDIPASAAYNFYSDRESFPRWMPFISSVKWIPNQKNYWRSIEGLPNSGCLFDVDIIRRASQGLEVSFGIFKNQLTVSHEVLQLLVPVASALQPDLEGLLRRGLVRFATLAKSKVPEGPDWLN